MIRGRVVKSSEGSTTANPSTVSAARRTEETAHADEKRPPRVIRRDDFEAAEARRKLLEDAQGRAELIVRSAQQTAARALEEERRALRVEETGRLASAFLELTRREEHFRAGETARVVELATMLAERILQDRLALEPEKIFSLARAIAKEARGAARLRFEVHPEDVPLMDQIHAALGLEDGAVTVASNTTLERGDVLLHTDLGTIDGRLRTQLARLRRALTE